MSREIPIRIVVANIALPRQGKTASQPTKSDYGSLLRAVRSANSKVRLRGDRVAFFQRLDKEPTKDRLFGVIGSFTKIDIKDDWFNEATNEIASKDDLSDMNIPAHLLPHFRRYNFVFDLRTHQMAVEVLSEPNPHGRRPLSPGLIQVFLEKAFSAAGVTDKFGPVAITIIPDRDAVKKIVNWKHADRIFIHVRPPNADHDVELEKEFERRLAEQNAKSYDAKLAARPNKTLQPDSQTKAAMRVAARNGYTRVEGYENGEKVVMSTQDHPMIEETHYNQEAQTHVDAFSSLADGALAKAKDKAKDN